MHKAKPPKMPPKAGSHSESKRPKGGNSRRDPKNNGK